MYLHLSCKWILSWHLYSVPFPEDLGVCWHVLPLAHWHSYNNLYPQQITSSSKYGIAAQRVVEDCSIHSFGYMQNWSALFLCLGALPPTKNSRSPSCCDLPPTDQPCWWFCLAPSFPSKLLALTNSPWATIAPARFLPVYGHGYWGGCEHTWPQRHKLSLCTPNSLETASNSWIHLAYNLKVHFLRRKKKLQEEKCLYLKTSLCCFGSGKESLNKMIKTHSVLFWLQLF